MARGIRLGPYELTDRIGAGGMGEEWRAVDTSLGRPVAIKVLPDTFQHDPERLARFEREAQTLAALNHPNLATVYGLVDADGTRAIAMELVSGHTLADRIARGPIPYAEALPLARQIAEALEAAHEQGIVHRDLKPANVMVRADETVQGPGLRPRQDARHGGALGERVRFTDHHFASDDEKGRDSGHSRLHGP